MTDAPEDQPKPSTADAARLALQMKQSKGKAAIPSAGRASERTAAARSAARSQPALRK